MFFCYVDILVIREQTSVLALYGCQHEQSIKKNNLFCFENTVLPKLWSPLFSQSLSAVSVFKYSFHNTLNLILDVGPLGSVTKIRPKLLTRDDNETRTSVIYLATQNENEKEKRKASVGIFSF